MSIGKITINQDENVKKLIKINNQNIKEFYKDKIEIMEVIMGKFASFEEVFLVDKDNKITSVGFIALNNNNGFKVTYLNPQYLSPSLNDFYSSIFETCDVDLYSIYPSINSFVQKLKEASLSYF